MAGTPILLATVNARYGHTAFGLRWLWANLGSLRERAAIREFHLEHPPLTIAEELLAEEPLVIGFGVYIWNVGILTQVVETIKGVRPDVVVVLGGPEAGHEYEGTALFEAADYLIRGEGETAFAELAHAVLEGRPPREKVIAREPPDLAQLVPPYDAYTEEDIAHRSIFVEASRGCPFRCDFCLSALDPRVREFPLGPFLEAMEGLIERGARRLTFVDRTFNLSEARVESILAFFRGHWRDGLQVHFEIVPDRLTDRMVDQMAWFPPAGLHLEVGVQSFNPEALATVGRHQDPGRLEENLRRLRSETGAFVHADLVVGLPGECWDSFAEGFDRLFALRPHEIQVGFLKRLKGAPISRHIATHALVFAGHPPYEVLQTGLLSFRQMQCLKRFARYFDRYYNAGNFPTALDLLWRTNPSPFRAFMAFADTLWSRTGQTHRLSLARLARELFHFLAHANRDTTEAIAAAIEQDYHRIPGRKDKLRLLSESEHQTG